MSAPALARDEVGDVWALMLGYCALIREGHFDAAERLDRLADREAERMADPAAKVLPFVRPRRRNDGWTAGKAVKW